MSYTTLSTEYSHLERETKMDPEDTEVSWILLNGHILKIVMRSCSTAVVFLLFWRTSTRISISSDSVWHAWAGLVIQHELCCQTLQLIQGSTITPGSYTYSYICFRPTVKKSWLKVYLSKSKSGTGEWVATLGRPCVYHVVFNSSGYNLGTFSGWLIN